MFCQGYALFHYLPTRRISLKFNGGFLGPSLFVTEISSILNNPITEGLYDLSRSQEDLNIGGNDGDER